MIDSTGELRDWTSHADVVIIGKSFLSEGGQNPCEAILAGKPVIFGPHMENFQPLAASWFNGGCISANDPQELAQAIVSTLDPSIAGNIDAEGSSHLIPSRRCQRDEFCHFRKSGNAPSI